MNQVIYATERMPFIMGFARNDAVAEHVFLEVQAASVVSCNVLSIRPERYSKRSCVVPLKIITTRHLIISDSEHLKVMDGVFHT